MALYTPNDALTFARTMIKSMPLADTTVSYQILDYIASIIWMAAPWRWTLGAMPQVSLDPSLTDYSLATPTDFSYLESAYLTDGKTEHTLYVDAFLPVSASPALPTKVAYMSATDTFRVHPKPGAGYAQTLVMLYKRTPPKVTAANATAAGATGLPDQWFWVYQLGVLWLAYHYADDARAGLATMDSRGQIQYTGFLGAFQSGLDEMRKSEKLPMTPAGVKDRG